MNDFTRLIAEGALGWIDREHAKVPTEAESTCINCGQPIVFKPYWLDGKQPNPPVWWHPGAGFTCPTRPAGWRSTTWPMAEPTPQTEGPAA